MEEKNLDCMVKKKFRKIQTKNAQRTYAEVLNVQKLDAKVTNEICGSFENRSLIIHLGIECIASACEKMTSIELVGAQTSLESCLNPTDFYYRVNTHWKRGCCTGSYGEPQFLKFEFGFHIDQRSLSEKDKPWNKPAWEFGENIQHFSFYAGMLKGFETWKLYRLDCTDIENVKFDFVKWYSYVQGSAIDI